MGLDISSLFTPAPSGISQSSPGTTPAAGSWMSQLLTIAATLGLQTSSWQVGGALRTMLSIVAQTLAQEDVAVSIMAQGGFLDFAASGTVTTTAANGVSVIQPVSPDPSVSGQNPTGAATWLDVLADSVYNVQRIGATQAPGTLAIANTTGNTYGPFSAGTYHVSNATTSAGYANVASLTIAAASYVGGSITGASNTNPISITTASAHGLTTGAVVYISGVAGNTGANGFFAVTVTSTTTFILVGSTGTGAWTSGGTVNVCTTAPFVADLVGPSGSASAGAISLTTTTLSGVSVSNPAAFFGQNFESNTALAARCRLKIQSLSPNGAAGAFKYFALTASQLLAAQTPSVVLGAPVNRVLVQSLNGVVTTTVANAGGTVSGVSNLSVSGAVGTPIAITTASAHGLASGNYVTLSGVLGNTNANGTWTIAVVDATHFTLNGSTTNATYTGGGIVEGGDLGEIDTVLQANCVPTNTVAITQSASAFAITVVGNIVVPLAQVATYNAAVQLALTNYFAAIPIGGNGGVFSYNDLVGLLYLAGSLNGAPSYVISMTGITINGGTVDLTFPSSTSVATLSSSTLTVTGA